ncbi:MAG: bifunctional phosphoribosylaminoimidazolecarboxamide formyltransferase/IMP cyclohydrolase [Bacteroidales bacterium]|nr:bifunctional phosphoribosylaminoimidazolecarboxamide formyltransferase/IMP cyclohydrolase [Bacteroidales bacterium]
MSDLKKIRNALISVYHKDNLEEIVKKLDGLGVKIFSTGGTKDFIEQFGIKVTAVEDVTSYPSIFGGRVKTLHPKVFGGILYRREHEGDLAEASKYEIPPIDLVIVDLYPFEETLASGAEEDEIVEKIDIGGISLIRAAAKNFNDVVIVPSRNEYKKLIQLLNEKSGNTSLSDRKWFAAAAFNVSSHYDSAIFGYFNQTAGITAFKQSILNHDHLRYGENPHQKGWFFGDLSKLFDQIHGKEISYNNLLDIDAAVNLMAEFTDTTFAILKHNNACGIASREKLSEAWKDALAGDPVSAYGGILITNREVDEESAKEINQLFFEIIIAPGYNNKALELLKSKKNRIILIQKQINLPGYSFRSLLNGVAFQDKDLSTEAEADMNPVTKVVPQKQELEDLVFANKIVKHTKSNTIVLAKGKQLLASGVGQTSRVDALKQAIEKAGNFGFDVKGAVMASDAFFPFPDCVQISHEAGINVVVQPGGSVKDNDSIEYCDLNQMAMVFTGIRHFKH